MKIKGLVRGQVHTIDPLPMLTAKGERLVHANAYKTLNEIPCANRSTP